MHPPVVPTIYQSATAFGSFDMCLSPVPPTDPMIQRLLRRVVLDRDPPYGGSGSLTPMRVPRPVASVNQQVLDALYAIQTTPYDNSFLSRIQGYSPCRESGIIAIDWETRTPWMELMQDIRDHYTLSQCVVPLMLRICALCEPHALVQS